MAYMFLKHSKSTSQEDNGPVTPQCEMYKISTLRNGNDPGQLSFGYRALSCGAD